MASAASNCLAFHAPLPLHRSPSPLRVSLSPRCAAHPPHHHNTPNTVTRRAFLAHLFGTSVLLISTPSQAQQTPETSPNVPPTPAPPRRPTWGYSPEDGPETWASLSDDWSMASTGTRQSPIPLSYRTATPSADTPRPTLVTNPAKFIVRSRNFPSAANPSLCLQPYVPPPPPLVGDAPPVDTYTPPPIPALVTLPASSATYALRTFHVHVAAEHVFEATPAPMEFQFVFDKVLRKPPPPPAQPAPSSASGSEPAVSSDSPTIPTVPPANAADDSTATSDASSSDPPAATLMVAMLATLVAPGGETAPWLSSLVRDFTETAGKDGKGPGIVIDLDMASVLPSFDASDLYMYTGSLTTPPCTEGVQWLVVSTRVPVQQSDVDAILTVQGGPNARPLQGINGRRVTRFPAVRPSS